tara:strand:- start:8747 stop:9247 length:501 start_codon:yes stop_codon:yes gene_type:complete
MNEIGHILSKHGVLVAFNIAKKVKQSEINKIRKKLKETCETEDELNEQLEKLIVIQIKNSLHNKEIPGIINKHTGKNIKSSADPFTHLPAILKQKILRMVLHFSEIINREKFNKELLLIVSQLLLAQNKITQKDIIEFNKKYKLKSFVDEDYLDNEEDDDEEDDQP